MLSFLDTDSLQFGLARKKLRDCVTSACQEEWEEYESQFLDSSSKLAGQLIHEFSASSAFYYGEKVYELDFNKEGEKKLELIVKKTKSIPYAFTSQLNENAKHINICRFSIKKFGITTENTVLNLHSNKNPLKRFFINRTNSKPLDVFS